MIYEALKGLEPARPLELFSELCQIPHGSKNERAISNYIRDFCQKLGLETYQDSVYNLIIRKPATRGYENAPTCVLQAHLDMVCEKNASSAHDFLKDPIQVLCSDGRIHANGTTLGADNGIGVAYAMAVLESRELKHPALEVVLTADEEAGMSGIRNIDFSRIHGRVIINLDCSDEGIVVGCAGTATVCIRKEMRSEAIDWSRYACLRMDICGMKGGHSGLDVKKERANANQLAARILSQLQKAGEVRLLSSEGGLQTNAITRENTSVFAVPADCLEAVYSRFDQISACICKEHRFSDPEMKLRLSRQEKHPEAAFTAEATDELISLLLALPAGLIHMNMEVEGLPELSGNIGIMSSDANGVTLHILYRSCYDSRKQEILDICGRVARRCGAQLISVQESPEWEYKADSRLSALIQRTFLREYGQPIVIEVSHGGNECGTFYRHFPDADIVCTGPRIIAAHSPDESVMIEDVQKEWRILTATLEGMLDY